MGTASSRPSSQQSTIGTKPATAGAPATGASPPATADSAGTTSRSLSASRLSSGRSVADINLDIDPEGRALHSSGRSSKRHTRHRVTKEQAYNAWFQPAAGEGAAQSTQLTTTLPAVREASSSSTTSTQQHSGNSNAGNNTTSTSTQRPGNGGSDQPPSQQGQPAAGVPGSHQHATRGAGGSNPSSRRTTRTISHSSSRDRDSRGASAAHHHHHNSSSSKDLSSQSEKHLLHKQHSAGAGGSAGAGSTTASSQQQLGNGTGGSSSSPAQGLVPGAAPAGVTSSNALGMAVAALQQQAPASTQPQRMGSSMKRAHSLASGQLQPISAAETGAKATAGHGHGQHDKAAQQAQHAGRGPPAQPAGAAQQAPHTGGALQGQATLREGRPLAKAASGTHLHQQLSGHTSGKMVDAPGAQPQVPSSSQQAAASRSNLQSQPPAAQPGGRVLAEQWSNRHAGASLRQWPHLLGVDTSHTQSTHVHLPGYAPTPTGDLQKGASKW